MAKKNEKVTPVGDFREKITGIFEMPSGARLRLRNPGGMRAFMEAKIIPNQLMPIMQAAIKSGREVSEDDMMSAMKNDDGEMDLTLASEMMDKVAVRTVIEPRMALAPTEADLNNWNKQHPKNKLQYVDELRDENILYSDELPDIDKMYIFQWITRGTQDLAQFRQQYDPSVAAVAASEADGTKSAPSDGAA